MWWLTRYRSAPRHILHDEPKHRFVKMTSQCRPPTYDSDEARRHHVYVPLYFGPMLRGTDSNRRLSRYERDELPLLHPMIYIE